MNNVFILHTQGDPLTAIRHFLCCLWERTDVDGMLIPIVQKEASSVNLCLSDHPKQMAEADPFVPAISYNTPRIVAQATSKYPKSLLAAVVHPCEMNILMSKIQEEDVNDTRWLTIGVDCMSAFSREDYSWRVEKAGSTDALTLETIRFSRMGGIAPYRFRRACQICTSPYSEDTDLNLEFIGLPVTQFILIRAATGEIADRFDLGELTNGSASPSLVEKRERALETLQKRRRRIYERMINKLSGSYPDEAGGLVEFLGECTPCKLCLEACQLNGGGSIDLNLASSASLDNVNRWLASCSACGLCEDACPKHLPLTAIFSRIGSEYKHMTVPAM